MVEFITANAMCTIPTLVQPMKETFTHRKHYDHIRLPFNNDRKIIPHLKPTKCLMNKNIPNLVGRDKAGG